MSDDVRKCTQCGRYRTVDRFPRQKNRASSWCKECAEIEIECRSIIEALDILSAKRRPSDLPAKLAAVERRIEWYALNGQEVYRTGCFSFRRDEDLQERAALVRMIGEEAERERRRAA